MKKSRASPDPYLKELCECSGTLFNNSVSRWAGEINSRGWQLLNSKRASRLLVIQVHHLKQLAEIGEQYEIDPVTDLRPVCANCHTIIHFGGGCRTIEATRSLVNPRVLVFWASLDIGKGNNADR